MNTSEDERYLDLLSIFHFVVAGIAAIFACFPVFHLLIGISFLADMPRMLQSGDVPFPFQIIPMMFILIPVALIAFGLAYAIAVAVAGYLIRQRKRYMVCLVIGAIETIFTPFGTVLGVFTIILLMRPAIKGLFQN